MRRRTFDLLATGIGAVLTVVLFVAAGLLFYGASFTQSQVTDQLSQQQITFPAADDPQMQNPDIGPYLEPYAGQQLTTGTQAEAYANHYIAVHLDEIGQGKTYAYWSGQCLQDPSNTQACETANTLFKGNTLRGLLLNAYAFWTIGQIAYIAAWAALVLGVVMLVMTILGYRHARKVAADEELFEQKKADDAAKAEAAASA